LRTSLCTDELAWGCVVGTGLGVCNSCRHDAT
jgi:hypothetical protein